MQERTTTDYTSYLTSALRYVARTAVDCIKATPRLAVATFLSLPKMIDGLQCFYGPAMQHHYCIYCDGCNGQEDKMLTLLKSECGITHLDTFKVGGGLPHREYGHLGNSTSPACTLYLSPMSTEPHFGPCVPDVMQRNVTSGLPDECTDSFIRVFVPIMITIVALPVLTIAGCVLYRRCADRFFKPVITPEDNERYGRISEKFQTLMEEAVEEIPLGNALNH